MARRMSQEPLAAITFFNSGFFSYRNELFSPYKPIGVSVVAFKDPCIIGADMENSDKLEWTRRPGFSIFCTEPLADTEVVNEFYSSRNLNGVVSPFVDTTDRLAVFSSSAITTVVPKTVASQGYISTIGNLTYFADGAAADYSMWDGTNLSAWGLAAGTITPTLTGFGFWQEYATEFSTGDTILDSNGNVESVSAITISITPAGTTGLSGKNEPVWNLTLGGLTADGGVRWTNYGPIQTWSPVTSYPTPIVVLDSNGFLQLGSTVGNPVAEYDADTEYNPGDIVTFGGSFWSNLATSTGVTPSNLYTVATTVGSVVTTIATWAQTASPIVTGDIAPVWNTTVGGTTTDGNYVWTNIGQGTGLAFTGYEYVYCYRTVYGHLTTGSPYSTNTGAILGPINGAITGFAISSNVVTFSGDNNFLPGNVFQPSGLTVGTYLNGQALTVISAIPSSSFPLTHVATDSPGTTLTITALNNLVVGAQVTFTGVGTATWLNGLTVTVLSSGLSGTQFKATIAAGHSSYSADDVGSVNVNGSYTAAFAWIDVASTDSGEAFPLIASLSGPSCVSSLCNSTATITAVLVSANIVTLTASNNFQPGIWVTITGLTNAKFIDGQQLQVIAVDQPVGTQNTWFQVYFENPNYPTTADSGTATFNAVEIYRTSDGGGTYLFAGAVTNPAFTPLASYDSGLLLAGSGVDTGIPGVNTWTNPNNVTSPSSYATAEFSPPSGGSGAFNIVQSATGAGHYGYNTRTENYSNGPANIVAALPNPVTAGNTLLCIVSSDGQAINSISDNQTNGYALIATSGALNFYIVETPAAGMTEVTVNVTPNESEIVEILFVEVQGIVTPSSVDVYNTATGTGSTFNTGSVTTINDPDILISCIYIDSIGALQPASDSLLASRTVTALDGGEYQLAASWQGVTTATSYSSIWTQIPNIPAVGITVALKSKAIAASDALNATTFPIGTVPLSVTVQGVKVAIDAKYNGTGGDGFLTVQLLKNGNPWGLPKTIIPTSSVMTYPLGSSTDLWGGIWNASDFTASTLWGVQVIAYQYAQSDGPYTFSIRNVNAEVYGASGLDVWVYNDFVPDANLNILLVAPLAHQNDPPPGALGTITNTPAGTILTYWQGRLWMAVGNYVYFDAGPDCTNGIPEHAWPPGNRFQFAGPVLGLEPTADGVGLLVILADRVNAILGGPETVSFYPTDALSNFGISNPKAIFRDGSIIGMFTTQKQYFELVATVEQGQQVAGQKQEIGQRISDYLTANFNPTISSVTMHRNGLDVGTFISNGVDQVLRFGSNIDSWSVPAFPRYGAGVIRSIETSVGITNLMLASPAGKAPTGKNFLFARDINSWGDAGTFGANDGISYPDANVVIGSVTLAEPGAELVPLQHVVVYCDAVGTLNDGAPSFPEISILPNEVNDTHGSGFVELPEALPEPPIGVNSTSKSILMLRYPLNMANARSMSQYIAHCQIKIQWAPENAPNSLRSLAFKGEQS